MVDVIVGQAVGSTLQDQDSYSGRIHQAGVVNVIVCDHVAMVHLAGLAAFGRLADAHPSSSEVGHFIAGNLPILAAPT